MDPRIPLATKFQPKFQLPLRVVNALGRPARRFLRLDADALVDAARAQLGDAAPGARPDWEESLRRYVAAVARAPLHFVGAAHVANLVRRSLAQRVALDRARPRLGPLTRAPLVVCGLPRSGTTFLHRLLAEADDAQAPALWELAAPVREPGPDRRLARMRRRLALTKLLPAIDMDALHLVRAELPDECSHLFKSAFRSAFQWQIPAFEWLEWHARAPAWEAYRDWRDWLALLAAPGRRYVLKDPYHVRHLPELFAVAPAAMVVRTHRDPLETLPSWHKLIFNGQAVLCERLDVPRVVEANTRWALALTAAAVDPGAGVPAARVYDVDYRRLVRDPVGVARGIHAHFGLGWDAALEARLARYVAANGQRKFGDNPYAIEEFGQTAAELARRFAPYREAFGLARSLG